MASHTRSGRLSQPALRWADEMVDRQAADRSQGRRRGGGNDQDRGPAVVVGERLNGEQLLIDAEDANLVENELEFGNEEGENIEIEGPAHPDPLEHVAYVNHYAQKNSNRTVRIHHLCAA